MINQSTNIYDLISRLAKDASYYYIEQDSISSKGEIGGWTVYSRYKKFNGKVTDNLIQEHLNKKINLALSLKNIDGVLFEYSGQEAYAFGALISKFANMEKNLKLDILDYSLNKLLIFISSNEKNYHNIEKIAKKISNNLEEHFEKNWRVLPLNSRPEIGNLLQLPREIVYNPWV